MQQGIQCKGKVTRRNISKSDMIENEKLLRNSLDLKADLIAAYLAAHKEQFLPLFIFPRNDLSSKQKHLKVLNPRIC